MTLEQCLIIQGDVSYWMMMMMMMVMEKKI